MENPREAYKEITLHILGYFQLLEFGLKAYIGHAYSTIKKSVGTKVHFDYTAKDVEEFPLERLLSIFSKLNANKELIKRLNKLRAERNHVAHNSLIIAMGSKYDAGAIEEPCRRGPGAKPTAWRPGEGVHCRVPFRRPVAPRYLRPEAPRAGRDSGRVSAHAHDRAGLPDLRAPAADRAASASPRRGP